MNINNVSTDENKMNFKAIFRILFRYKYMILTFVLVFGLGSAVFTYFIPNIYKATSLVEVGLDKSGNDMTTEMDAEGVTPDTEILIITSRSLSERIAKKVDFAHKYYTTRRWKEIELYKSSPFKVGMNKGFGTSFKLYPIDEKTYRLVVEKVEDENHIEWSYDGVHLYDKEIKTDHFHLNVIPVRTFEDSQYRFVIIDPEEIGLIVKKEVTVRQPAKKAAILEISYTDNVALRAREATNAITSAYLQQNIEKKNKAATLRLDFVDKQLKRITENLKGSAVKLEEFKRSANTINLSAKAENIIRYMSESETKLEEISIREEMLKALYTQVKSGKNLESLVSMGTDKNDVALAEMIRKLQDAILQKKILRADYTELHPQVRKFSQSIKQLKKLIISTIKNLNKVLKSIKFCLKIHLQKSRNY